jgi:hypothetical protein
MDTRHKLGLSLGSTNDYMCILIIYPLAVSAVHVMNEFFSPSRVIHSHAARDLALRHHKDIFCCFVFLSYDAL